MNKKTLWSVDPIQDKRAAEREGVRSLSPDWCVH